MFSGFQRLVIQLGAIFWFALLLIGLLGFAVIGVLPWWMIALVVLAGVLVGAVTYLPRWLLRRNNPDFAPKKTFLVHAAGGVLVAIGLAAAPVYYMSYWVSTGPTALPLATLSNGKKVVVFQGMQHIGSEDFYKSVVFDLEKALTEGYTLFYEGVQPVAGRPDLDTWFNETLRGTKKDLSAGYQQLADNCGLTFQLTYFEPLLADKAIHPSKHVVADVSYLDMKNEYDRLMREDAGFAKAIAAEIAARKPEGDESSVSMLAFISKANREQKRLIGILCRGVIGMSTAGLIGDKDTTMEKVILEFRNRALARFVAESQASKIYITYGAAHYPGFLQALQGLDPAFKVQSLRWVRPMSIPQEPVAQKSLAVTR